MKSDSKIIAASLGTLLALSSGRGRVGNPFQIPSSPAPPSRSNQKLITMAMGILLAARLATG